MTDWMSDNLKTLWFYCLSSSLCFPIGWGCRIHWLHLCRRIKAPNQCPGYDIKQSDGEAQIILELWGIQSTPSLPSLLGPLWPRVVALLSLLSILYYFGSLYSTNLFSYINDFLKIVNLQQSILLFHNISISFSFLKIYLLFDNYLSNDFFSFFYVNE